MIPLRDHNPSGKVPWITYMLMVINVLVFLLTISLPESQLEQFIYRFSLIPRQVVQGVALLTLITSIFLHGGWGHLIGNMIFLHIFGDNLEDRLGHLGFLIFYLVCGVGASLGQILLETSSQVPVLGASGAIAGVMGGYLVLFPQRRIDVLFLFGWFIRTIQLPAYTMLFYWFFAQVLYGVGSLGMMGGGVAYFAHVGGFITGAGIIYALENIGSGGERGDSRGVNPGLVSPDEVL